MKTPKCYRRSIDAGARIISFYIFLFYYFLFWIGSENFQSEVPCSALGLADFVLGRGLKPYSFYQIKVAPTQATAESSCFSSWLHSDLGNSNLFPLIPFDLCIVALQCHCPWSGLCGYWPEEHTVHSSSSHLFSETSLKVWSMPGTSWESFLQVCFQWPFCFDRFVTQHYWPFVPFHVCIISDLISILLCFICQWHIPYFESQDFRIKHFGICLSVLNCSSFFRF